ncbi:hypothetical protein B0T21DRAFT_31547 [Apiosordaria backusii]|uniref:Xylanolytic transcriptional activator regulatory domain-containing protein n=1 Tax=Apiosordaria backusii TaxID=314023 RepID=A0AA40B241_9PEZI|nr:hypothetical protein B0T21DRAFT_31547 [Apiosordaria backusii]
MPQACGAGRRVPVVCAPWPQLIIQGGLMACVPSSGGCQKLGEKQTKPPFRFFNFRADFILDHNLVITIHLFPSRMSSRKRRSIHSCTNCYTRKWVPVPTSTPLFADRSCDRIKPVCTLCARRGVSEDCVYYSSSDSHTSSPTAVESQPDEIHTRAPLNHTVNAIDKTLPVSLNGNSNVFITKSNGTSHGFERGPWGARHEWSRFVKSVTPTLASSKPGPSLADSFGYFQDSDRNTLALIQKLGVDPSSASTTSGPMLTPESVDDVHRILERIPDRQILDFLIQYFRTEVNWMDHLVHVPWFYPRYQSWWRLERITTVKEVDFAILVLRLCSYTLRFLPSPYYTLDRIRGVLLADIRIMCDETADSLESISTKEDSRGSLLRVQSLAFYGLHCQIEGKTREFWEALSRAIQVAQDVGIHCDAVSERQGIDQAEREMGRRTYCNLFIWDSLLSRHLDRVPFIPGRMQEGSWPDLQLLKWPHQKGVDEDVLTGTEPDIAEAPDPFTERFLQAKLADFWRGAGVVQRAEYDMIAKEDLYELFNRTYISTLPPAFSLTNPDETWDVRFPKLPLQRKLLHMAIYDSILWNFRPLLLRKPSPIPAYKSVMLSWQKRKLAATALYALEAVAQLHTLLHGCHTRLASIVVTTFESAVLLVYLSTDPNFPEDCPQQHLPPPGALKSDPLQAGICKVSLALTLQGIQGALKRLQMLAEVNTMAEVAATTLVRAMNKASELAAEREVPDEVATVRHTHHFGNRMARPLVPATTAATGPSTTTISTSHMTSTSLPLAVSGPGCGNVSPWLSETMPDLRSVNDFMSGMNGAIPNSSAPGDIITSWPSFDPSHMYGQGGFGILEES